MQLSFVQSAHIGSCTRARCVIIALAVLCCLVGLAAAAEEQAVHVKSVQQAPGGMQVVLSIAPPSLVPTKAKDGNVYTKVLLSGCGNDNDFGRAALPIISHTVEVPLHAESEVTLSGEVLNEIAVDNWVYPHQPPIPKVLGPEGNPPFVMDMGYYAGAKSLGFQKAFDERKSVVSTSFKKRGHQFLNIMIRPVAYDVSKGVVQYPSQVQLNITWVVNALPKAAGPRTGVITVVEVTLTGKSLLDDLLKEGFDIASRKGDVVTIYATDAELNALRQKGLIVTEVEKQPRPNEAQSEAKGLGVYHSYATLTTDLEAYAVAHPAICRLISVGKSVENRELWAMKITDNPDDAEDEPEVKYVGSIHGDEPLGAEMCVYFIDYLLTSYGTDQRVTDLVNETEIWVLPLMNPDGHEASTRYNHNGFDLNRSFPDGFENAIGNVLYGPAMDTVGRPVEVVDVMQWSAGRHFVLSANFHGGALLVNYPYDNDGRGSGVDSPSPDDTLFEAISETYSSSNLPMWNSTSFTHGITNGAAWYEIDGGMQDWNYRYEGCNEVTIELSNSWQPSASAIPQFWSENRESMLSYIETVKTGVRGIVTDAETGLPIPAAVEVVGKNHLVYTDPNVGDYHRQLLPGTYDLVFCAPGYQAKTVEGVSVADGSATRTDVHLQSSASVGVIVVSNSSMAAAASAFRTEKQAEGFEVYDVTITGSPMAETVRGLVRTVYNAHLPKYVIILGDIEIVPTFSSSDGYSDLPYALMDTGEGFANYLGKDLFIGRVSLKTEAAIGAYTNKLATYAANVKHRNMTWISGGANVSENNFVEATHDWVMANALQNGYDNKLFYQNDSSIGGDLTSHINSGTDGVVYSGHGSETSWMRYGYNAMALAGLTNALDAPMVFGHCCLTGSFAEDVCFAESWLLTTGRGIVYIGASSNTYWDEDDILEKMEFQAMKDAPGLAICDAVAAGLEYVHSNYPGSAQYYYTVYQNFGDPTLSLFGLGRLAITTPAALPVAYVGEPFAVTINAVSGEVPYTWSLVGTLPDDLTFSTTTHTITGTPSAPGTDDFTIQVTDNTSALASRTFHLIVLNRFSITTPEVLPAAALNQWYSVTLATLGEMPPVRWSVVDVSDYVESDPGTGWVGGGVAQNWTGDEASWPLTLPWPFPFYGTDRTTVNVCSNGFLDFASNATTYLNGELELSTNVRIAPLWDDLTIIAGGTQDVFVTQAADYVVIRWAAQTYDGTYPVNVEAVLYRNGNIKFNYGQSHSGLTPTIGISSGDGSHFLLSTRNNAGTVPANVSSLFVPNPVLPPGLAMSAVGVISGTPTQLGEYQFLLRGRDAGTSQQVAERQFHVTVVESDFRWVEKPSGGWKEVGDSLLLRVVCGGTMGGVTYQWIRDGDDISGETNAQLDIASLTEADQGWYTCRVTDESKGVFTFVPIFIEVFPEGSLPVASLAGLGIAVLAFLGVGVRAGLRRSKGL